MKYMENILDAIGGTPLVKLNSVTAGLNANLFAKLEFFNPGGSIKDRMVKYLVDHYEATEELEKGTCIVENSSGNTGASLSLIAAIRGYRCIITMPDKMSSEKINKIKAFGAEVVVTPTDVPASSELSYYSTAARLCREHNALYPDQYNNPINVEAHYRLTGPEIWEQTEGEVDMVICGIGTGGTISGVGKYLKEQNPDIKIVGVDPVGSVFYDYFKSKQLTEPRVYCVEGIGEDYLVKAVDFSVIDDIVQVTDQESFSYARRLAREEGILAGGSSGAALAAAIKYCDGLPTGTNVLIIMPDSGTQYLSKIYNDQWMQEKGLL